MFTPTVLFTAGVLKLALLKASDLSGRLPLPVRYVLAQSCFSIIFLVLPGKRRAVCRNLRLVLGREPGLRDVLRVFLDYGRYWAELADLNSYWRATPRRFVGDPLPADGTQFVGLTLHVGNFELFGPSLHETRGGEFPVVAEALRPAFLTRYFARKRRSYHIRSIPHDAPRDILATLHRGEPLGIVCDRAIDGEQARVSMLGTTLNLPVSIVDYAVKHGIAVHIAYIVRDHSHITVYNRRLPVAMALPDALREIGAAFEDAIRRHPYQWHVLAPIA